MSPRTTKWEELERELLADPQVRKALEELEPAYQVARLRIMRGLSQRQLAEMVGTKQPAIARLESGEHPPSLSFLNALSQNRP
jgi:predicted transcriptional regulator